jgi:hypothetical protein
VVFWEAKEDEGVEERSHGGADSARLAAGEKRDDGGDICREHGVSETRC